MQQPVGVRVLNLVSTEKELAELELGVHVGQRFETQAIDAIAGEVERCQIAQSGCLEDGLDSLVSEALSKKFESLKLGEVWEGQKLMERRSIQAGTGPA